MENKRLIQRINELKEKKNAVVLVHNYQRPEIYKIADYIGDSFGLAKRAAEVNKDIIVFCGVDFMAESAKILNPEKKVLIPAKDAVCKMAAMVNAFDLRQIKEKYPKAAVVSYVNTTADVKAESDVCCTSSNAVEVVNSLPNKQIIFTPDKNLASYVQRFTDKEIILWDGFCYVHNKILPDMLQRAKEHYKNAKTIVHPECAAEVIDLADQVCSTSGMIKYAKESDANEFIIGTERGMIERLRIEVPDKKFYFIPPSPGQTCIQMKKNTLELTLESLEEEKFEIKLDKNIMYKARKALDRMLEVGK